LKPFTVRKQWGILIVCGILGQFFISKGRFDFTLVLGVAFYGAAFACLARLNPVPPVAPENLPVQKWEFPSLIFIVLLALGLRLVWIDRIPCGLWVDQGFLGYSALRILHEGWHPFLQAFSLPMPLPVSMYEIAGWFGLVGDSAFTLHLFFILTSVATLPFAYWLFRDWAGPRIAMVSVFIFAVLRWPLAEARAGISGVDVPFYMLGTLALFTYGRKSGKHWPFFGAALFCGAGLYTYQSLKAFPLFFLFYVLLRKKDFPAREPSWKKTLAPAGALLALLALPLGYYVAQHHSLGFRESECFIGPEILKQGSLSPFFKNCLQTALMFNWRGDPASRVNIPGHPMLDDITGIFFIFGLFLAFRNWKKPPQSYVLTGLGVMSLPAILSFSPTDGQRLMGMAPFAAFLAAQSLVWVLDQIPARNLRGLPWHLLAGGFLLLALTAQNSFTYFVQQARNQDCWNEMFPGDAWAGQTIVRESVASRGKLNFFLTPFYTGSGTVDFLTYRNNDRIVNFPLPESLRPGSFPVDRDALFILDEGKSGYAGLLKTIFPGGIAEEKRSPWGVTILYTYRVPSSTLKAFGGWNRGLSGIYIQSNLWNAAPWVKRVDPVINFTNRRDFPFVLSPPFRICWNGTLRISNPGIYQFHLLTTDRAQLTFSKKGALDSQGPDLSVSLAPGAYPLRLLYAKDGNSEFMALHLLWKPPGQTQWEVVPATAFGSPPKP
jgi:hypothetical protein